MTRKKERRSFSNFGFSTILLSFVMICVISFSALSLITAHSDYTLSKTVAQKNQQYYAAERSVSEKIFSIDALLADCYIQSADESSYYANVNTRLINYGTLEQLPEGYFLSFKETISEQQHLSVQLQILYPREDRDTFFEIREWRSVYNTNTFAEETLPVMQ